MDCEKLGFTKEDKSSWCGKIVSCRADKNFTACKALCEIGDVYYADGTCGYVQEYDNTKIPVGIVFYTYDEGRHGKVVSLHFLTFDENNNFHPDNPFGQNEQLGREQHWSFIKSPAIDLPLTPYSTLEELIAALKNNERSVYAGKENTQILWENSAALMVKDFYPPNVDPSNPVTGQGKWFLPSVGEFLMLWNPDTSQLISENRGTIQGVLLGTDSKIKNQVDTTLEALKSKGIQTYSVAANNYYWTSTYRSDASHDLYAFSMTSGHIGYDGMSAKKPIRVMLDF